MDIKEILALVEELTFRVQMLEKKVAQLMTAQEA